ncbi:MAG: HAD family hydrolase [Bacteroidales bacterium]
MNSKPIIVWDWNGTLLDDVDYSIETMNSLLRERGLDLLDREKYRRFFEFPVIKYYQKLGFDFKKESFEVVGLQFMKRYFENMESLRLFEQAETTLRWFRRQGYRQWVLSAMEQQMLERMLSQLGVKEYFERVAGIDNHYGGGKLEAAERLWSYLQDHPGKVWMIGDTLHDAEIGQSLGVEVILVAQGHQNRQILSQAGVPVMESLAELVGWFYTKNSF